MCASKVRGVLTVSGVSDGWTRWPSKRNRTDAGVLPCRSQNAVMSFSSFVLRLILKNTSLLLSVTLMFRCSVGGGGGAASPAPGCPGLPFSALSAIFFFSIFFFLFAWLVTWFLVLLFW